MSEYKLPPRGALPVPDIDDEAPEDNPQRRPPLPALSSEREAAVPRRSPPKEVQEVEAAPPPPKPVFDVTKRSETLKQIVYAESDKWPDDRLPHLVDVLLGITRGLSKDYLQCLADRAAKTQKES